MIQPSLGKSVMAEIELFPDLSHCIEAVARKEYEDIARCLLTGVNDAALEERLSLLRDFLETADFRELRRRSEEYLLRGMRIKFLLYREHEQVRYRMTEY